MGRKRNAENGQAPETAPPVAGHNSATMTQAISEGFERFKALQEEKNGIGEAQGDILNSLKETFGLSKSAMRRAWMDALRDPTELRTLMSDYDTVMAAIGQLAGTPLGDAALPAQPAA